MILGRIHAGRYYLVWILWLATLATSAVTRVVLMAAAGPEAELTVLGTVRILAIGGLYDTAFCAYAAVPWILLLWLLPNRIWTARPGRWACHGALLAWLGLLSFAAVAELLFWHEFSARFNFIAVDYLIYTQEVIDNILQSYPIGPLLSGVAAAALVVYWPLRRRLAAAHRARDGILGRTPAALLLLLVPAVEAFTLGQGPRESFANALQAELAGNGPYQFFAAFRNNELDYNRFYPTLAEPEADRLLRRALAEPNARFLSPAPFDIEREIGNAGPERRLNVVLITVESLSAGFLGRFGDTRGLTPFLDGLIGQSLFFDRFYATGTRTVRGLEAVTLSIPPTPGRSIVKRIGRETGMWSLGNVLRDKGYAVRFLYGGRGYFDNMNAFFSGNGYAITDQSSVADAEIEFANAWGMSDEDLYRQVIKEADAAAGMPFFFHVMTTSNHRPYTYPEARIDIPSGSGREGAVKYTDYALRRLIEQARSHPWFDNTLFVILADHTASAAGKQALPPGRYHIPLWIYGPKHVGPAVVNTLASQIDVAPTLLGLLGMSYRSKFFGRDVLRNPGAEGRALIANYQHLGLLRPGLLADLSPVKQAQKAVLVEETTTAHSEAPVTDPLIREGIAYYQGASFIYQHRLNRWPGPQLAHSGWGRTAPQ